MKKFDLQAAVSGKPVFLGDGRKVLQLCYFPGVGEFCIAASFEDWSSVETYRIDGTNNKSTTTHLFMTPTERTVWVNLSSQSDLVGRVARWFNTEQEADLYAVSSSGHRIGAKAFPVVINE